MDFPVVDIQSRFVNALRTQRSYKTQDVVASPLACPFGHQGRIFQNIDQLLAHRKEDYPSEFNGLDVQQAKPMIQKNVIQARNVDEPGSSQTRVDIDGLFLNSGKQRLTSPTSRKKRRADFKLDAQRTKAPTHVETINSDYSKDIPFAPKAPKLRTKPHESRLFNFKRPGKDNETSVQSSTKVSEGHASRTKQEQAGSAAADRQSGLMELQKDDPRYPGFLLQPGSRPISQEQLASEVKNIYTGLIMVETECIRVERAQAAAPKDPEGGVLDPDHWQALIALHRTLLHEHHDFFLAAQHPSANPALRRLAGKYTMPALLWKHGIHSFLELLCQRLPGSPDMLAFIHLAYQMMALLYETVPAFEDTWIECLGDLGRYRMAIEDEDIRDRETWANVARFWYSKAADKNPAFDRLYHYLVIPALPNALQQLYYYLTSLNSVDPFHTARQSIMTQFRSHFPDGPPRPGVPIDTTFIKYHALLFTRWQEIGYESASTDFLGSLDNHIGGVTAKWKEQGVCTAVSNIAAWFDYGVDANLHRQIFPLRESHRETLCLEVSGFSGHDDEPADVLTQDSAFAQAQRLTDHTLSLVLRRIGDKNVLPHDHVMLSFLSTLASTPYVSHLIQDTPWTESTSFLDTLIKNEESKKSPIFEEDVSEPSNDSPGPEFFAAAGFLSWWSPWKGFAWKILDSTYDFTYARFCKFARATTGIGSRKMMVLVMASLPKAFAYDPASLPATLLRKTTVFDYVMYSLILPSMGLLWWLGPKTSEPSFIVKLLFSFFWFAATNTSSLFEIRTTIVQIWTVFAFNYIARDCAQAIEPGLHLVKYLVLSALFISLGSSIQATQDDKVLKVTPIALALAAVVLYFISKRAEVTDNQARRQQDLEVGLPDPAVFDLESLRSESTVLVAPTTRPTP